MADVQSKTLLMGAKGMKSRLEKHFDSPEQLKEQIAGFMESPQLLEKWATDCIRRDETNPHAHLEPEFKFAEIPPHMVDAAVYSMAVAYLMSEYDEVGGMQRGEVHRINSWYDGPELDDDDLDDLV